MIKFFRKIRQQLLSDNKFSKYLLYAIGEIVLVVIGIMIALNINAANERKINDREIRNILKEIQNDLEKDVQAANKVIDLYMSADSIQYLILNDKYTFEDYENGSVEDLGTYYVSFIIQTNGFDNLMRNIDNLPEKYKHLLPELNDLYVTNKNYIDTSNDRIKKTVYDYLDFISRKPWAYDKILRKINREAIHYHLNDNYFKSHILNYMTDLNNILLSAIRHKIEALSTLNNIEEILGDKKGVPQSLKLENSDISSINNITGTYKIIDSLGTGWDTHFEIQNCGNKVFFKTNDSKKEIYYFKNQTYFDRNTGIYQFDKSDTLTISYGIYGKTVNVKSIQK
ncbi:MAG: hypothetical protein BM563_04860 [Bacteroidetes bacterium MedPE-SWsnd-G1]|nr:MAG: hypothetical protein BM563_04860 [Bacteroidetes bacterium MedPE-SWsnd-G1]